MNEQKAPRDIRAIMKKIVSKFGIYLVALGMVIICSLIHDKFLTERNIINIFRQVSFITIAGFAQTLLLISGGIDLALGSTMALSGIGALKVYLATGSMVLGVLAGIVIAIVCCTASSILVTRLNLHPFITTLAMQGVVRGLVLLWTGGITISQVGDFGKLGQGSVLGIPNPVIGMLLCMLFLSVILRHTTFGRKAFACGGNPEAARASGINVKGTLVRAYIVAGILIGISGVLMMSWMNSGLPTAAEGYEGDAIAAAVIGGTAFTGGGGTALGTLVGGLIVGIINNILNLCGVHSYVQQIIQGLIIVVAVALDMRSRKKRGQDI